MFPADLELIREIRREGPRDHRLSVGRGHLRRLCDARRRQPDHRRSAAADAALRPRAGLRLLLVRRGVVRQRDLERRALRGLRQGRPVRRLGSAALERREPRRQGRLQGVDAPSRTRRSATSRSAASTRSSTRRTRPPDLLETWARNEATVQPLPGRSSCRRCGLCRPRRNQRPDPRRATTSS